MRSTEHRHLACGDTGHPTWCLTIHSAGETLAGPTRKARGLHHALPKQLVFSGEQFLHEIETAFIGVACGAGEMMIDSHAR